ncbi:YrrS family protein [Fictibacillus halophilus]|uniref:YrrS family protein n=1 Tax=Fictibacillus halophilus TaxID=1610490 RepID=UPI003626BF4F
MRRYNQKDKSTKKRNVVLFSALGAVLLALLFLPKDALLMGNEEEEPVKKESKEPKHKVVKLQPDNESAYEDDEKSSESSQAMKEEEQEPSEEIGIDPEKEADKKEKAKKAEEEKKKQAAEAKKKEQAAGQPKINEPIGTSQTGTHTSSYEEGSVDWNEKLKAIRLATGLDETMTVWKIANGGGPQKSVAEVSPDGKPGERYTVNLEWVDQKGWKVTSVEK